MIVSPPLQLINAVVLLILLTALCDPEHYHLTSAELANDLDVMDDSRKSPATRSHTLQVKRLPSVTFHLYSRAPQGTKQGLGCVLSTSVYVFYHY